VSRVAAPTGPAAIDISQGLTPLDSPLRRRIPVRRNPELTVFGIEVRVVVTIVTTTIDRERITRGKLLDIDIILRRE